MKFPKPWFRPGRGVWYVTLAGKQHNLGTDRDQAFDRYRELLKTESSAPACSNSVVQLMDQFLDWTKANRAPRTFDWYQERCQSFATTLPEGLNVAAQKPFHVQQWGNAHPAWSSGMKRGCMIAVQRAFNWAEKLGHLDR